MNKILHKGRTKKFKQSLTTDWYEGQHIDFIQGFNRILTPQGNNYWMKRYYWIYEQYPEHEKLDFYVKAPMSDEDWGYLRSFVRESDPFLEDKENEKYETS